MKLLPRAIHNENDGLIAFLSHQVESLILCSYGLDEEQIRAKVPESDLTIGGLLKHVTFVQQIWIDRIVSAPEASARDGWESSVRQRQFTENFLLQPEDTLESLILRLREQTIATVEVITNTDLDTHVPISPNFIATYPAGTSWSVRWVIFHLIEEIARHGGHADIIREGIDGASFMQLALATETVER